MITIRAGVFTLAIVFAWSAATSAPTEAPPDGFTGLDYVDSAGCAYRRAQLGDRTVWAQRLSQDGTPLCGLVPTRAELYPSDALAVIPPNRRGTEPTFPAPGAYIQVGAFTGRVRADGFVLALQDAGLSVLRQDFRRGAGRLRVLFVGPFENIAETEEALVVVRQLGFSDAFVRGSYDQSQ